MSASKPHSTQQAFQVIRECLAQGQRAMDELGWTQRDVMVQSTLGRLEEQYEVLHEAATKAWAILPVDTRAHAILGDALLAASNPASEPSA